MRKDPGHKEERASLKVWEKPRLDAVEKLLGRRLMNRTKEAKK